MKKLIIAAILAMSCATLGPRPVNPDGSPAPYPEEMDLGSQVCQQMCMNQNPPREMDRYLPNGKCLCKPDRRTQMPRQLRDGRLNNET